MDGTRKRRTRDKARQAYYARHRQRRFARFLGFDVKAADAPPPAGAGALMPHEQTCKDRGAIRREAGPRKKTDLVRPLSPWVASF